MQDRLGRQIDYLRLSVTDRCNLRCRYCMPEAGVEPKPRGEILTLEEMEHLVRVAAGLGFRRVRLTGGEPLVRRGLMEFVEHLAAIPLLDDLSLTTNGLLFAGMAEGLRRAGLNRVNISLDTLKPERYRLLTRVGDLKAVLEGIEAALAYGFHPVKLNVVAMRGFNEDELPDFLKLAMDKPLEVRFIELMPIGESDLDWQERFLPAWELYARVKNKFSSLQPIPSGEGGGPANLFSADGWTGKVGFITAISEHFCGNCNRLRVTADGKLRPCLHDHGEIDLKQALRDNSGDEELEKLFHRALLIKPTQHNIGREEWRGRQMSQIGG